MVGDDQGLDQGSVTASLMQKSPAEVLLPSRHLIKGLPNIVHQDQVKPVSVLFQGSVEEDPGSGLVCCPDWSPLENVGEFGTKKCDDKPRF